MKTTTLKEYREQTIEHTDIRAVCESWGIKFTSEATSGWVSCHAIRDGDERASAQINLDNGVYNDLGGDEDSLSLFDLGAALGKFSDWQVCLDALARDAGVTG